MERSPHEISDEVVELSHNYGVCAEAFAKYIKVHADFFNRERKNHKSDTATIKAFEMTEDGVNMAVLKAKLKSIEKKMSALRSHLRVLEAEARNQM